MLAFIDLGVTATAGCVDAPLSLVARDDVARLRLAGELARLNAIGLITPQHVVRPTHIMVERARVVGRR